MIDPPRHDAVLRDRGRILYVSDPSSAARFLLPDPVQVEDLCRWVDMLADAGVDLFNQEVFSQGWTVYWRSRRYEYDRRLQHRRFLPLLESDVQPLQILIDQSHRRGMKFIAGLRLNDGHTHEGREQNVGICEFIASHPRLHLPPRTDLPQRILPDTLDFSHEPARDFTLGVIEELADRFELDGIELCLRDRAYFPPGAGEQRAHLFTDLIRRIRARLNERTAATGRSLLLGARVHATIEECAELGLDIPAWIREGLIDYVCPQDVMYSDFNLPYHEWAAMTRDTACSLFPGVLPWTSYRGRYRRKRIPMSPANCRAMAHTLYAAGSDGVSIYNHLTVAEWHAPFYPQAMQVFHQMRGRGGSGDGSEGERHYLFEPTWADQCLFGEEGACVTGRINARKITLDRRQPQPGGEYRFFLYEEIARVKGACLLFRGAGLTEHDELEVRLNGFVVPDDRIGRTSASDTEPGASSYLRNDRVVPCQPEAGWFDFRATPGPAFSTRWFTLTGALTTQGDNFLSIRLTRGDPHARGDSIIVDELEIWVQP